MNVLELRKRSRMVRGPVNEYDKATIVSILPKKIEEVKPTLDPGIFNIPPGSFEKPAVLVVGPSSWWRDVDEKQPLLEIPTASVQVAKSVVDDYCNGLIGCDMVDKMPGLFFLPGVYDSAKVRKEQAGMLIKYQNLQKNWFLELVLMADVLWARSNGNPLAISDDARLACTELGIKDKAWLKNYQAAELTHCIACGSLRNPAFPVCPTCHAICDIEQAKKLGITFAA